MSNLLEKDDTPLLLGGLSTLILTAVPYTGATVILPAITGGLVTAACLAKRHPPVYEPKTVGALALASTFCGTVVASIMLDIFWILTGSQLGASVQNSIFLALAGWLLGDTVRDAMAEQLEQVNQSGFDVSMAIGQVIFSFAIALFLGAPAAIGYAIWRRSTRQTT